MLNDFLLNSCYLRNNRTQCVENYRNLVNWYLIKYVNRVIFQNNPRKSCIKTRGISAKRQPNIIIHYAPMDKRRRGRLLLKQKICIWNVMEDKDSKDGNLDGRRLWKLKTTNPKKKRSSRRRRDIFPLILLISLEEMSLALQNNLRSI